LWKNRKCLNIFIFSQIFIFFSNFVKLVYQTTPRVQNPFMRSNYATPPPSFASMKSSVSTQQSILRQSRLNYLKCDTRSSNRTPDQQMDDISPFDSVSNYDENEEPMETSFGNNTTAKINTSFGSDVGSILSATLNTSVQVNWDFLTFFWVLGCRL